MIHRLLLFIIVFFTYSAFSQEDKFTIDDTKKDTIVYEKNLDLAEERNFPTNFKEKYTGKDFEYVDQNPKPIKQSEPPSSSFLIGLFRFLIFFFKSIFPFLLAGLVVFLLLKFAFGFDLKFKKKRVPKNIVIDKISTDESYDLNSTNFEQLLANALQENNYRLAIRCYYLLVIKKLCSKKIIDYHKEKTNSEYELELDNHNLRNQFTYLSYIYNYVWYGEFTIDEINFKKAQKNYQSFLNHLK